MCYFLTRSSKNYILSMINIDMEKDIHRMTTRSSSDEKTIWKAIKTIYRFLATPEAQEIIRKLEKTQNIRSKDLIEKTGLTESQFHPVMKELVRYAIIDRTVNQDRSVSYNISSFGLHVLDLSSKLLDQIKQNVNEELIAN